MNLGIWRILVPLGAVALLMAGCSGGGGGEYSASNSPEKSTESGGISATLGGGGGSSPGIAWLGAVVALGGVAGAIRKRFED